MKLNFSKIAKIILPISIIVIIIGYFLWTILIPIQDMHTLELAEQKIIQKEYALNYGLGRFLLYSGFAGLVISSGYLIVSTVKKEVLKS